MSAYQQNNELPNQRMLSLNRIIPCVWQINRHYSENQVVSLVAKSWNIVCKLSSWQWCQHSLTIVVRRAVIEIFFFISIYWKKFPAVSTIYWNTLYPLSKPVISTGDCQLDKALLPGLRKIKNLGGKFLRSIVHTRNRWWNNLEFLRFGVTGSSYKMPQRWKKLSEGAW